MSVADGFSCLNVLTGKKPHVQKKEFDEAVIDWARKACHRCLIYLGDIGTVIAGGGTNFSI